MKRMCSRYLKTRNSEQIWHQNNTTVHHPGDLGANPDAYTVGCTNAHTWGIIRANSYATSYAKSGAKTDAKINANRD